MRKIEDIKNEEAFEVIADLLDPITKIVTNAEVQKVDRKDRIAFIKVILKNCKKELIEIFAILDGVPVNEYELNFTSIPMRLVELFNDKTVVQLFGLQGETKTSSGSATENTEVTKK